MKRAELFDNDELVELLAQQEYFTLPLEAKLKILAFLCNEFMNTRAFRLVMEKNMSRKAVLAIQLRDLKREIRTLQQDFKAQINSKSQTAKPKAGAPLERDESAKRERSKFEKAEQSLQKEVGEIDIGRLS